MIAAALPYEDQDELTIEVLRYSLAADHLDAAVDHLRENLTALKALTDEFERS